MKIFHSIAEMQKVSQELRQAHKTIGFVPTMGFLHEGHETLIKEAKQQNDVVVLSIFVNPLQFGPNEDFDAYPRDIKRDETIARKLKVDYLFYPATEEMYKSERATLIKVEKRVDVLCGKNRPGHFDGVATVVMKLFQIVMPHNVYFGMKDAQQVAVLEGLITDYHLLINLVRVNTVREHDGLAKSSRNVYLTEEERTEAPSLYRALLLGKDKILKGEEIDNVTQFVAKWINENTQAQLEYLEILSYPTLAKVTDTKKQESLIIAVAAKYSKARLIDNIVF
ncbi:pantoate--beta-alanine ligase [Sutcliffiella deserti]|uniref:pantoate--beta-alanine ligase n=1 Tax=Sutcliffiella deserti TaxID=2875501 RepID=UPI001CBBD327|nr:pantoate--beta-alanine ligase [Sutcliffiella deserti]